MMTDRVKRILITTTNLPKAAGMNLLLSFLAVLLTLTTEAQIISDFSSSADGWTCFDVSSGSTSAVTYNSAGGNPTGNISFTTSSTFATNLYFNAPAKFNGNLSTSYNQNLTLDLMQSTTGTDNTAADIIFTNSANLTLVYQLPAKPNTSWSSYIIPLNETAVGWHVSAIAGAAPTKDQMKQVLSAVTTFRIRVKYLAGSTGLPYTGSLDNVIVNVQAQQTPPSITSISPLLGIPNTTTVTITGNNFNTTASQDIVFFSGVKAAVISASSTQLIVKVPQGAQFGRVTVLDVGTGRSAQSTQNFSPQFNNNSDFGGRIIPASLAPKISIPLDPTSVDKSVFSVGDVDGDGWNDLVVSEMQTAKVSVWRNLQVSGGITPASFAPKVSFPLTYSSGKGNTLLTDFDGDGKLDLIVGTASSSALMAIFRNTSVPGTISFAPAQYMAAWNYVDGPIQSADLDGDGRPELMSTWDNSSGGPGAYFTIFQNLSTPGDIEFAAYQDFDFGILQQSGAISTGDLDGDGKLDLAVVSGFDTEFYIFQNTSVPGTLSFNTPFVMGVGGSANYVAIADLDNDNKLDLAWNGYGTNTVLVSKNISTPGPLSAASFSAAVTFTSPLGYVHGKVAVADINSDSKPDIVVAGSTDLAIFQNQSASGILNANSFMTGTPFAGNSSYSYFIGPVISDFDADGKLDVVLGETTGAPPLNIDIYRNACFPAPVINTVTPSPATTGAVVTITGNLMQTGSVSPQVTVRDGILLTASNTPSTSTATATVPVGAKSDLLNITVHGLTAFSQPLPIVFPTNRTINAASFPASINFPLAGSMENTLITADWDDDGRPDVGLIDSYSSGKIFQNTQATAGQPITSSSLTQLSTLFSSGYCMAALDIDGDGKTDLHSGYSLFQNSSSGGTISFASEVYTNDSEFTSAATADFNRDGKTDIAATPGTASVAVYENLSKQGPFISNSYLSTFSSSTVNLTRPGTGGAIVAADFDGDGNIDIATANPTANNFSYFQNLGVQSFITTASFAAAVNVATGLQPDGIASSDFDGDGLPDIAITHFNVANNYVSVYHNTSAPGTISFAGPINLPCQKNGFAVAAQDLDGDGKTEIVVIHQSNPGSFSIFQNTSTSGSISFAPVVNYPLPNNNPQAIAFADINLDNKPDILLVAFPYSSGANALMVFENMILTPVISIVTQPLSASSVCDGTTQTLSANATGTTNITYQWQIFNSGTNSYVDLTNTGGYSNVSTATLSINTTGNFGNGTYQCKISGDFASTVYTSASVFTVNPVPNAPTATGASVCSGASAILSASGGVEGQYRWYTSLGVAISGQMNNAYTTPALSVTTTYYVSINNGTCESSKTAVIATLTTSGCSGNQPPVIAPTTETTTIGGEVVLDLTTIVSDPNNNIDLSTLSIISQPLSGAPAVIDSTHHLIVNYQGISFSGADKLTIQVCDLVGACSQQEIIIDVGGSVIVYNAVSPNGDGKNDTFVLDFIDILPTTQDNHVSIFDRWGDEVFSVSNYDNTTRVFAGVSSDGKQLPPGTYFYKVTFSSGAKTLTGYLQIKR